MANDTEPQEPQDPTAREEFIAYWANRIRAAQHIAGVKVLSQRARQEAHNIATDLADAFEEDTQRAVEERTTTPTRLPPNVSRIGW